MKPSTSGPTQKSVALQTGESISENSQTVYTSAEDEFQATKSSNSNPDNPYLTAANANTSASPLKSLETPSVTEDSIADISFSFASQNQQPQQCGSMFLSNHYGPDKLLHGTNNFGVNRSASFHTGDQLRIDSPSAMLRIPRSQPFYPGVYMLSHDVQIPEFHPHNQPR
ncbi:unnamed protein product [Rodentolepis nana]|uniref:Ovule protein n=1 Tax=Rodentolepis nana TaxID=102285 RepID=A0A0R3TSL4_RODNA|nr:unnamed protein product [Rodentolepis nana]